MLILEMEYIRKILNDLGYIEAKIRILKKMRGVPMETFQSHLDFIYWKILKSNEGNLFVSFLNDIRTVYRS